jgi:hypothetical protein
MKCKQLQKLVEVKEFGLCKVKLSLYDLQALRGRGCKLLLIIDLGTRCE